MNNNGIPGTIGPTPPPRQIHVPLFVQQATKTDEDRKAMYAFVEEIKKETISYTIKVVEEHMTKMFQELRAKEL